MLSHEEIEGIKDLSDRQISWYTDVARTGVSFMNIARLTGKYLSRLVGGASAVGVGASLIAGEVSQAAELGGAGSIGTLACYGMYRLANHEFKRHHEVACLTVEESYLRSEARYLALAEGDSGASLTS